MQTSMEYSKILNQSTITVYAYMDDIVIKGIKYYQKLRSLLNTR